MELLREEVDYYAQHWEAALQPYDVPAGELRAWTALLTVIFSKWTRA